MKKKRESGFREALAALAVIAVGASLFVLHGMSAAAQSQDEQAVRDALLKSSSSFEKSDLAEATKVWANDDSLTVFESGHANYGWADYRDNHLGPEMREMKHTKYAFSDIKIHLAGQTAWATFKYTISADVGEAGKTRRVEGAGLSTAVLEKREGQWRIVHWHSSAPRRAPAATPSPAAKP